MNRPPLKTYSHLATERRMPSEYDIVTTQLLYYVAKGGFEVRTPVGNWYERYQQGSGLRATTAQWARFRDPHETTYTSYTGLQKRQEEHLDTIMQARDDGCMDCRRLSPEWLTLLSTVLTPQRYLFHGFQMVAAYIGQMAPEGRIVITAGLQAADEVRRVQRIAYRMAQLRKTEASFGQESAGTWQSHPAWQPIRCLVERALVTYDWGEALVSLNVCIKPALESLFGPFLGRLAERQGDYVLHEMTASFARDCAWHRDWTLSLLRVAYEAREENRTQVARWMDRWSKMVDEAIVGTAPLFGEDGEAAIATARAAASAVSKEVMPP